MPKPQASSTSGNNSGSSHVKSVVVTRFGVVTGSKKANVDVNHGAKATQEAQNPRAARKAAAKRG